LLLLVSNRNHVGVDPVAAQQSAEAIGVAAMIKGADLAVGQVEVHHEAAAFEHDAGLEATPAQVIREHPSVRLAVEVTALPGRAVVVNLEAVVHRMNHNRGTVVNYVSLHVMLDRRTVTAEVAHANPNSRGGRIRDHRHSQTKNQDGRK